MQNRNKMSLGQCMASYIQHSSLSRKLEAEVQALENDLNVLLAQMDELRSVISGTRDNDTPFKYPDITPAMMLATGSDLERRQNEIKHQYAILDTALWISYKLEFIARIELLSNNIKNKLKDTGDIIAAKNDEREIASRNLFGLFERRVSGSMDTRDDATHETQAECSYGSHGL